MNFLEGKTAILIKGLILVLTVPLFLMPASAAAPEAALERRASLGIIQGIVRDDSGPIADATVAIFHLGTSRLLKQVQSASDGSFIAKVIPGTYTILAVAEGYNPKTLAQVEVSGSSALTYGFKLERAGSGNTLPEKRLDRNNPKWVIRSAQTSRSIYQNAEGTGPAEVKDAAAVAEINTTSETSENRISQSRGVLETYFGSSKDGAYTGVNFATLIPLSDDTEIVVTGQTGSARAPQRLGAQFKYRPNETHQLRFSGAAGKLGSLATSHERKALGQVSLQALDEWKVREGVILVFGVDYSRFVGAGNDFSISPRLGFQFDVDPKTRVRSSFTTQTESRTWSQAIDLEDSQVLFREPVSIEDFAMDSGHTPRMNKSNRLEFGIERVLDNHSSVEANFFLDTSLSHGISLTETPVDSLSRGVIEDFTGDQRGGTQGFRLVYSRRLSGRFSTAAGYSFGRGQKLSARAVSDPAALFKNDLFQTVFAQFDANLKSGTNVKTIFRLSPAATVFAIDPFQGRLAIYDPGLSVLVTQDLPTLGLPFHAQAIVDARNLFDFQFGVAGDDGLLKLNSPGRVLRGGILVRF
ncbi:MAG: carboxypeptidase regulatory-like domain-containing protein [Pyrinomonadaceae bacterium]